MYSCYCFNLHIFIIKLFLGTKIFPLLNSKRLFIRFSMLNVHEKVFYSVIDFCLKCVFFVVFFSVMVDAEVHLFQFFVRFIVFRGKIIRILALFHYKVTIIRLFFHTELMIYFNEISNAKPAFSKIQLQMSKLYEATYTHAHHSYIVCVCVCV